MTGREIQLTHSSASPDALRIYQNLPKPDYARNYQPTYRDQEALLGGIHELCETQPVTTPRQVDSLQATLTGIAIGEIERSIIITERCAEPVDIELSIETMANRAEASRQRVLRVIPSALIVQRNRGQNVKPRTSFLQRLKDGQHIVSYMGDAVNIEYIKDLIDVGTPEAIDEARRRREPDASRMVAAAIQARSLEEQLTTVAGDHIPSAHEALLLPYEQSFIRKDPETGHEYLLSTGLPWIGKRTNALDGPHVAMLAEVENPIGIKIGPDSTAEHIRQLHTRLNPRGIPGKLIFMLRMGAKDHAILEDVLGGIKEYAPHSLNMYDIHGVTKTAPTGEKIRLVGDVVQQIQDLSAACGRAGLMLHGLHLETINDSNRLECVDEPGQLPTHPGGVDPQLNPRQLTQVLAETADYLLRKP